MSIYTILLPRVNEAARAMHASGHDKFTAKQISEWISLNHPAVRAQVGDNFPGNFSYMTREDPKCIVERVPGKFLYQISTEPIQGSEGLSIEDEPGPSDEGATIPTGSKSQREEKLYAVLKDWLTSRGYQAAITAPSKKGGVWGNPDLTGIRTDQLPLGQVNFECATIEAKLSSSHWKYWLFEAVSHKRFAHRAWFAFAVGTDSPSLDALKDARKMCEYAEQYRIGILVVFVSKDHYSQLTGGDVSNLTLSPDDVRIEVLWPAFYEPVQIPALNEFMTDVLQIKSHHDLGRYGIDKI